MQYRALSPNIIVKVSKEEEKNRREMEDGIYLHPNYVWLTRNTQHGIIEAISDEAKKQLPEAEIGDTLLFHHFVQRSNASNSDNDKFLATEDEENKFYNVTAKECNGEDVYAYGIYRNGEIIPHKQYVFLEKEIENKDGWYQTEEQVAEKIKALQSQVSNLCKTRGSSEISEKIMKLETEMMYLNLSLRGKEYLPYKIAFANKALGIPSGAIIFALNIACETVISVLDKKYRIIEAKYIGAV